MWGTDTPPEGASISEAQHAVGGHGLPEKLQDFTPPGEQAKDEAGAQVG